MLGTGLAKPTQRLSRESQVAFQKGNPGPKHRHPELIDEVLRHRAGAVEGDRSGRDVAYEQMRSGFLQRQLRQPREHRTLLDGGVDRLTGQPVVLETTISLAALE